jgi:hypothetical protein
MAVDRRTQATVRALWEVGARYGRPPAPVPEVDPWEDDAAGATPGAVVVELDGVPAVVVHLGAPDAVRDTVRVEDSVDLEVPRADVVAVVESLLAGRARRHRHRVGLVGQVAAFVLGNPLPSDLEVPVAGRVYRAPILVTTAVSGWLLGLPADRG